MNKRFTALNAAEALEFSREGFLSGRSVIFAAGIYNYRTFELGLPSDYTEDGIVRVYYSEEEVRRALPSFDNNVITNDHPDTPDGLIDVTNYEFNSQGTLGSGATLVDGQVEAITHFKGASVVTDIIAGKRDVSVGLSMSLELEAGADTRGNRYDARGVALAGNHCALVDRGRVASARVILGDDNDDAPARILLNGFPSVDRELPEAPLADGDGTADPLKKLDTSIRNTKMVEKTNVVIALNGTKLTFPDQDSADKVEAVFNSAIESHKSEVATIVANHESVLAAESEKVATLTEEKAALEAQLTPEAIALNTSARVDALALADKFGVTLVNAETATTQDLNLQILNGSNHPEAASFTNETPVAVVNAALSGMTAMLPKSTNPLENMTVANADSIKGADAYQDALRNPASRASK